MSVLIKGMKMPHSCMGCRFCEHGSINEWDLYCGIDNKHIGNWDDKSLNNGHRPDTCPLVEIPKPQNRPVTWGDVSDSLKVLDALLETIEAEEGKDHDA